MRFIKTILFFLFLVGWFNLYAQDLNQDLIFYYPLAGNANDISGNMLNGIVTGATPSIDRHGNQNGAYYFDGFDDFIYLGNNELFNPYPPITLSYWIKYDNSDIPSHIFTNDHHPTNYYGFKSNLTQNKYLTFHYADGGPIGPQSRTTEYVIPPPHNVWFHFAATLDEYGDIRIFINGVERNTISTGYGGSLLYGTGDSYLGFGDSGQLAGPTYYSGFLDDVRFYKRILTEEEILLLAENNSPVLKYQLTVDRVMTSNPNSIKVPVLLDIPDGELLQAFEIDFAGFASNANFIDVDVNNSDILSSNWQISSYYNQFEGVLSVAGATSDLINTAPLGILFELDFEITGDPNTDKIIPVNIYQAIMNDNLLPVEITNGQITYISNTINYGDVNLDGRVQAIDASLILQYLIGQINLNPDQFTAADVTLDETVSGLDAQIILDYLTGKVYTLPFIPDSNAITFDGNIYMNNITVTENEEIKVPVFIDSESNMFAVEADLNFNPNELELINIQWAKSFNDFSKAEFITNGNICLAGFGFAALENDTLATLVFNSKKQTANTTVKLERIRINESNPLLDIASSNISIITGVEEGKLKYEFRLNQNYPNPFNPSTLISFTLAQNSEVTLEVYDLLGKRVSVLIDSNMAKGKYEIEFDGKDLNSGLYLYKLTAGKHSDIKKMILLK